MLGKKNFEKWLCLGYPDFKSTPPPPKYGLFARPYICDQRENKMFAKYVANVKLSITTPFYKAPWKSVNYSF